MKTCAENASLCGENASCMPSHIGGYSCRCNSGFVGNGLNCKPEPEKMGNFLLLNQGNTMMKVRELCFSISSIGWKNHRNSLSIFIYIFTIQVPYKPTPQDPAKPIMMQYLQQSIGISIDCTQNRVYWSDIAGKKIESANYKGTDVEKFITEGIF